MDRGFAPAARAVTAETIEPASIEVHDGVPFSTAFDDIYHSKDGSGEVQRVFLDPSGLGSTPTDQPLWVGELGFGSALNFAVLAEHCLQRGQRLHFVSCDAAPIHPQQFAALAAQRASELPVYHELARQYPPLLRGWHRRYLSNGQVTLSLYWGSATDALHQLATTHRKTFSAWWLDGFAPDRNPELWTPNLLTQVGTLSGPHTTVATFTAAGRVRRALTKAGFEMRRVDQRPHKRESLAGHYRGAARPLHEAPRNALVVGAGLAGAAVARRLAERGVAVRVLEAGPNCAAGASGIAASMAHARLLGDGSVAARLRTHAYLHSTQALESLRRSSKPAFVSGALQLPRASESGARLADIAERYEATGSWVSLLDQTEASRRANWQLQTPALWFPHSHALSSSTVCELLLDHPNITLRCDHHVAELPATTDTAVVLACAEACRKLPGAAFLELANVHGQLDLVELPTMPTLPIVGNGYLVPWQGQLALGSTYEYQPWAPEVATQHNLRQLTATQRSQVRKRSVARGTRCVSSDRTPVVGALYDQQQQAIPGRYVLTGLGSMGNVMSHYGAEVLASEICGEFAPAEPALLAALSPLRFRHRQAKRGYRLQASS